MKDHQSGTTGSDFDVWILVLQFLVDPKVQVGRWYCAWPRSCRDLSRLPSSKCFGALNSTACLHSQCYKEVLSSLEYCIFAERSSCMASGLILPGTDER